MSTDPKAAQKPPKVQRLRAVLPIVWELTRPRVGLLSVGFLLMIVNRVASLVLPYSTKFLFDNVIPKHSLHLLDRLVLVVLGATMIQGITSFSLTQLLSKEAQRLITELRQRVQKHISRLPVAFYDANKTGMLVSRIMSDVEGVRNLLGTGLVDFAGGLLTSAIALVLLLRISAVMTSLALGFLLCFALALTKAFGTIRPIFRERGKINAEVTGRLTESLGGVRVIKGYHAEEREEAVFASGVKRLLENVMRTLTATSVMSLSASVLLGVVGRGGHVCGSTPDYGGDHVDWRSRLLHCDVGFSDCAHGAGRWNWNAAHRSSGGVRADSGNPARSVPKTRIRNAPWRWPTFAAPWSSTT